MNWYVRKNGSNNNGGSSASLTPERTGSDMTVTDASTTATSASANFTAGDVGKGINISTLDNAGRTVYRIAAVTNSTTITLDRVYYGNGTSTNRIWAIGGALQTVSKLITAVAGTQIFFPVQAGDTIHVGAGVYRETLTMSTSYSGSQVKIRGDVDGSMTGDAGEVQITAYTTNDLTAPSSSSLINVSSNKNYWAFENLVLVGGSNSTRIMGWNASTNLTFTNCTFISPTIGTSSVITHTSLTDVSNILYDRCRVISYGPSIAITLATHASADYDANVVIRNCVIQSFQGTAINATATGALTFKGGGVYVYNCFVQGTSDAITTSNANVSTTYPMKVENCIVTATTNAFDANTSGQIVENYNLIAVLSTPRVNVSSGANTVAGNPLMLSFGQENLWSGQTRPAFMPAANSGAVRFGCSSNAPSVDILGAPRPDSNALKAVGPYERSNTWVIETSTVDSGSNPISSTGPGYHDFYIPVTAATETTVSMKMRYDSTYSGNRPQFSVVNSTSVGVADQTVTVTTGALNAWEEASITFTPTTSGVVTVRLLSRDTTTTGKTFADTFGYEV